MGKSTSGDGHGQKYGAGFYVDSSGSVLYSEFCEQSEMLPMGWSTRVWEAMKEAENNVSFYQTGSPSKATSFRSYRLLAVAALQDLKYDEKLFVDNGNNFEFN